MQKKLIKLALISSFIIPQMRAWADIESQDQQQQQQFASSSVYAKIMKSGHQYQSKESFLDFMDVPLFNETFLRAQKLRLKTVGDITLEQFLDDSPMMQKLVPGLRKQFLSDLQVTTTGNLLQEFLITKESNPRLYHQLMRVMRAQNFSRKQMRRAQFYRKMGEVNADAYTASVDGVGFELLTGLDDIANSTELRGVMGHELGHIRSGHVFIGVLDSVLQIQAMKQLLGADAASLTSTQLREWDKTRDKLALNSINRLSERFKINRGEMSDAFIKMMRNTDETISRSFSGDERTNVLQQYLDVKIATFSQMEMNASDIQLIKELKEKLGIDQVMKANMDQVTTLFQNVITTADSRNMESSADAFGNIVVRPSHAARMDMKFAGAQVSDRLTTGQLQELVQRFRDQVNMARKTSTRAQYNNKIGGKASSDHPFSGLRVIKQAAFDQHIDRIALANPFLNRIVFRDQAVLDMQKLQDDIAEIKSALDKPTAQALSKRVMQSMILKKEKALQAYQNGMRQLDLNISDLLSDPRFLDGNPRVLNLLDLRMAELQIAEMQLVSFEESLSGGVGSTLDAAEQKDLHDGLIALVTAAKQDPMLLKAVAAMEAELVVLSKPMAQETTEKISQREQKLSKRQQILAQVKTALGASASLQETFAARTEMHSTTKSVDRISLAAPTLGPKNSNTQWDASAPAFKDETPKALANACKDFLTGK